MTEDLLDIPKFLQRELSEKKQRRMQRRERTWAAGVPVKRPTKHHVKILTKRGWTYQQVMKLTRHEANTCIVLSSAPEARFAQDKKTQFPDKKDDE